MRFRETATGSVSDGGIPVDADPTELKRIFAKRKAAAELAKKAAEVGDSTGEGK